MVESQSFLAELEDAVSKGTAESCLRALWHATDILIAGTYSEEQIWAFGEIIGRLAEVIELSTRIRLANKLAPSSNAPSKVINKLASDDSIDVAGPVLRQSERLDVETLIASARTKGQQHLLAISKRKSVPEAVTDVLVVRGGKDVVASVAANGGAQFSNSGFLHLVRRSEGDSILAECVGLRKDIPRHLFHQLISKASEEVKRKLQQERPEPRRSNESFSKSALKSKARSRASSPTSPAQSTPGLVRRQRTISPPSARSQSCINGEN